MKHLIIALLAAMMIPFAAFGKKKKKETRHDKALHDYRVALSDGSTVEGFLSKDWVRWPAKSINVNFKIKGSDGTETKITVEEIDTIYDLTNGDKFIAANIPVPKIGNIGRVVKWIAQCGPKSEHGEIITYVSWFSFNIGTRSEWRLSPVHCMRFENDTIVYPFQFPSQNGSFNMAFMKKRLKESS